MDGFRREIAMFRAEAQAERARAAQRIALQAVCGIDLAEAEGADPPARALLCSRIGRMIERERMKGARRHWSYDLNRHIALKQALDHLRSMDHGANAKAAESCDPAA